MTNRPNWPTRRVKYLATLNDEALTEDTEPDYELLYIDIGNVDSLGRVNDIAHYRFEAAPSRARRLVADGDVIISTVRTYLEAIASITAPPQNLVVSTGFAVVRPKSDELDPGFCKYALRERRFMHEVVARSTGISYPAINASDLSDIALPVPPINIQRRIAAFLDVETERIDALVIAKQRLLDLLVEKRRALITRAVAQGVPAKAPHRDSDGLQLEQVPAHWSVLPLRRLITSLEQGWSPVASNSPANAEEHGVLKLSAIKGGCFIGEENKALPPDAAIPTELLISKDDVFITRANTPKLVGDVAVAERDYPNLIFSDLIYRVRADSAKVYPNWLALALRSDIGRNQIEAEAKGSSATMVKLAQDQVLSLLIPVPTKDEQLTIAIYVQAETKKIDDFANATERTIALLQERRSALISAAVTGQLEIKGTFA